MLDRIEEIDTSAIEELSRIKRDQEVLEGRLALMQERRDGVSAIPSAPSARRQSSSTATHRRPTRTAGGITAR